MMMNSGTTKGGMLSCSPSMMMNEGMTRGARNMTKGTGMRGMQPTLVGIPMVLLKVWLAA